MHVYATQIKSVMRDRNSNAAMETVYPGPNGVTENMTVPISQTKKIVVSFCRVLL